MANAQVTIVDVPKVVVTQETVVSLELTLLEAAALVALFRHVGGVPGSSARGITDGVYNALLDAGVPQPNHDESRVLVTADASSVYFVEGSQELLKQILAR